MKGYTLFYLSAFILFDLDKNLGFNRGFDIWGHIVPLPNTRVHQKGQYE